MPIRRTLPLMFVAAGIVTVAGGGALAAVETDTVESFGEGVWWAISLMTTVGFAGATPHSAAGKVLSALLMVMGFALLTATTAAIASLFVAQEEEEFEEDTRAVEAQILSELRTISSRLDALERGGDH